jgi:N6-adenosine-specific RNA methylase IME4/ParB-like chromosome segregation protein Spo0J
MSHALSSESIKRAVLRFLCPNSQESPYGLKAEPLFFLLGGNMKINIADIKIKKGRRAVDKNKVRELADSIQEIGLLNPITVTRENVLIAGAHRVEAFKLLGKKEIPATVTDFSDLKVKLAEIDENLIRQELDEIEIGELAIKRDEILEQLGIRAKQGNNRYTDRGELNSPLKTTAAIAKDIGISERVLQQNKQLAKNLTPEVKEIVRKHDIPKADKLKLARMDKEKQRAVADKIKTGEAKSVIDAQRKVLKENIVSQYKDAPKGKSKSVDIHTTKNKYRVIYADPPWAYGDSRSGAGTTGATDHYPTMPLKDICALPVKDITDDNAVLFLWVTSPLLEDCFSVIKAWGFKYKASFVWDKIKHNMGHYNSVRHELLLICTKGSCVPDNAKLFDSVQSIERGEHSEKPEEFRDIINTLYDSGKKLELFARKQSDNWDTWGFEA